MTPDELIALLERTGPRLRARVADSARVGSRIWPSPACVPLSRLAEAADRADLTEVEAAHVLSCGYCQAAARKLVGPPGPDPD